MSERFNRRAAPRRAAVLIYGASTVLYLGWRLTVINWDAPVLSFIYLAAEALGFVLGLTQIFSSWTYHHRESPPAPGGLAVDVFVTTYREPVELVRWTVRAARDITYPHRTVLLDDGNRPAMRAMAEALGVEYRARGCNVDAKAGNLNFGLAHSTADFVMVLDADHIALPHALDVMLGFFTDPRIALVQTPQDYYNVDAFQYCNARNGALWHDQSFYYGVAQPCRDRFDGSSSSGTSVVYRRSALDAIGGVPVETVTEDLHTSLKLHKAGYVCVYLAEPVAYGVAAADVRDYYRTRRRWAHGNLHALRIENAPFTRKLTLAQRLCYLTRGLIYLEGWQQLLLYAVPVGSLLFGWAPFRITVLNVLVILLFPVFAMTLLQEFSCGLNRIWASEIFSAIRFPVHLVAVAGLFGRKMPFRTSAKNFRGRFEWALLTPQLAVAGLSLGALGVGIARLAFDFKVGPLVRAFMDIWTGAWSQIAWEAPLPQGYTVELVAIAGFWALFNALKTGAAVHKAFIDARTSSDDYRFAVRLPATLRRESRLAKASIERISLSFLSASVHGTLRPGEGWTATIYLPSGPIPVDATVTHCVPLRDGRCRIECDLAWRDPTARERLALSLYSVDWHREFMHRDVGFATPLERLGRLLTFRSPLAQRRRDWLPGLVQTPDSAGACVLLAAERGRLTGSLLAFQPMREGDLVRIDLFASASLDQRRVRVLATEPLASAAPCGHDGVKTYRYRVALAQTAAEPSDIVGKFTLGPAVADAPPVA